MARGFALDDGEAEEEIDEVATVVRGPCAHQLQVVRHGAAYGDLQWRSPNFARALLNLQPAHLRSPLCHCFGLLLSRPRFTQSFAL